MTNQKFIAIICEHNPTTAGHRYLIEQAKKMLNLPVICVMSGNFVQRGEPACFDKYMRADQTLNIGADIVIELPTIFAISPAKDFAYGAIKLLNALKNVKYLVFGSECGNLDILQNIANQIEKNELAVSIKDNLKNGKSYAKSVVESLGKHDSEILSLPNNLLGVEYLNALKQTHSKIVPITVQRKSMNDSAYPSNQLLSATESRKILMEKVNLDLLEEKVKTCVNNTLDYNNYYNYAFSFMRSISLIHLAEIAGVTEGLEYRIKKCFSLANNFEQALDSIVTRRYNDKKIKRIILNTILGITNKDLSLAKRSKPYAKILAIKKSALPFIKEIFYPTTLNNKSAVLISKKKDFDKLSANQKQIIAFDIKATSLYSSFQHKTDGDDFLIGFLRR